MWKVGQKRAKGNKFEKIAGKVGKIWEKLISLGKGRQKVKSREKFKKVL